MISRAALKVVELKVLSLIVLLIVGALAGYLLVNSRDDAGALIGGYACLGLFVLIVVFLVVFYVIKEHYEAIMVDSEKSHQSIEKGWKAFASSVGKTNRTLEEDRRQLATVARESKTYTEYEESGREPSTNTQ